MAFELSDPMSKFLYDSGDEASIMQSQMALKDVSEKHTSEWKAARDFDLSRSFPKQKQKKKPAKKNLAKKKKKKRASRHHDAHEKSPGVRQVTAGA